MGWVYRSERRLSPSGVPYTTQVKVWVAPSRGPSAAAANAAKYRKPVAKGLTERQRLAQEKAAARAAIGKRNAALKARQEADRNREAIRSRMWDNIGLRAAQIRNQIAPPTMKKVGPHLTAAERTAKYNAVYNPADTLAKQRSDLRQARAAANASGVQMTEKETFDLEKLWARDPDKARRTLLLKKKLFEDEKKKKVQYATSRLKLMNVQAKPGTKKAGKTLEGLMQDALVIQRRSGGKDLDQAFIESVRAEYMKHIEGVAKTVQRLNDKANKYFIIAKSGKNKGKAVGYVGGEAGRLAQKRIRESAEYKAAVKEHGRLFGDDPKILPDGTIVTNGQYDRTMRALAEMGKNQRLYIRDAAKEAFFGGKDLETRQEFVRQKEWDRQKWMFETTPEDIDPATTSVITETDKNGKVTTRHRTVEEEFEFRQAQYQAEEERQMKEAQNRALLAARQANVESAGNKWGGFSPADQRAQADLVQWQQVIAAGLSKTEKEGFLEKRANVDKVVEGALADWERKNKHLFQTGATGRGSVDGMSHMMAAKWGKAKADQRDTYYRLMNTSSKSFIDTIAGMPIGREATSVLFAMAAVPLAGLRIAAAATRGHGEASQMHWSVTAGDLPPEVQNQIKLAGQKAFTDAKNAPFVAGQPRQTAVAAGIEAERKAMSDWLASGTGSAWERQFKEGQNAETRRQNQEFLNKFYGDGTLWEKMDALQEFGANPTTQPLVNAALGIAFDPTIAMPMKLWTFPARAAFALKATEGMNKAQRLAKGFVEFQKVTEADLRFQKGAKAIADALGRGEDADKIAEEILAKLSHITDPTARELAGKRLLRQLGVEAESTNEHLMLSAAQELILKRYADKGVNVKGVAQRVAEIEQKNLDDAAAARDVTLQRARAHMAHEAEVEAKVKALNEQAAAPLSAEYGKRLEAPEAELAAAQRPIPRPVEVPHVEREIPGSVGETLASTPVAKAPTPTQVHVSPGHPQTPTIIELQAADSLKVELKETSIREALSEGERFATVPGGGLSDVRVVKPDAAQAKADMMLALTGWGDVSVHHGVEFAHNDYARNFLASPEYKEIERILSWKAPEHPPGTRLPKEEARHRADILQQQAEARRELQNVGKESIWQRNRELESVARPEGPLVKGVIPWDETRGEYSVRGGRKSKDMYIASPSDSAQASASRSPMGGMGTNAERRAMEMIGIRITQAQKKFKDFLEKGKTPSTLTAEEYRAEMREIRRLGVIRRHTDVSVDMMQQEGQLISTRELAHYRVDQVRDFIPMGNQMVNDFLKTHEIGPYYHQFTMLKRSVQGPGYQTELMEMFLDPHKRARITKQKFTELFMRHFTVTGSALPGPIEFRQMGQHLYALFHSHLLDADQAMYDLDKAIEALNIRRVRDKLTDEVYQQERTLLIREAHAQSDGSLDLLYQYSIGVMEVLARDPTNIYARMWQVMEVRAGVWWGGGKHMEVEEAFLQTVLGTGYPLHPNLALGMIRSGPIVRIESPGHGFVGHLRNMSYTDSPQFAASPYLWDDPTVVRQLDLIAKNALPTDELVRIPTMISHYIASRYGNTKRRAWFRIVTGDYSIDATTSFARADGKGAAERRLLRDEYIKAYSLQREQAGFAMNVTTSQGGKGITYTTPEMERLAGTRFDQFFLQGLEPEGKGVMPQTKAEIQQKRAPVKAKTRGMKQFQRRGFDDVARRVYDDLYWNGHISHENPGLHTQMFLDKMGDPEYARGDTWVKYAKVYWRNMDAIGAGKEAKEVIGVLFEQRITLSLRDAYEEIKGVQHVSIYDDAIDAAWGGAPEVKVTTPKISLGGAEDEIIVQGKLNQQTQLFIDTGHIDKPKLERIIAEGEQRVPKERGEANQMAELQGDRDLLLQDDDVAREKKRAAKSESDAAAMYAMASVDHLVDDAHGWGETVVAARADEARLVRGRSNLEVALQRVERATARKEKVEARLYRSARALGATDEELAPLRALQDRARELRTNRRQYVEYKTKSGRTKKKFTEEYRVLRTEIEAETDALNERIYQRRTAFLRLPHQDRLAAVRELRKAEEHALDMAQRGQIANEWLAKAEALEKELADMFAAGKGKTKGYSRVKRELAEARATVKTMNADPASPFRIVQKGYSPPNEKLLKSRMYDYKRILADKQKGGPLQAQKFLQGGTVQVKKFGKYVSVTGPKDPINRAFLSARIRATEAESQLVKRLTSVVYRTLDMESMPANVAEEMTALAEIVRTIPGGEEILKTWGNVYGADLYASRLIDHVKYEKWFKYVDMGMREGKATPMTTLSKDIGSARKKVISLQETLRTGLTKIEGRETRITDYPYYERKLAEAKVEVTVLEGRMAEMVGERAPGTHVPKPSGVPTEAEITARTGPIVGVENLPEVEPWVVNAKAVAESVAAKDDELVKPIMSTERRAPHPADPSEAINEINVALKNYIEVPDYETDDLIAAIGRLSTESDLVHVMEAVDRTAAAVGHMLDMKPVVAAVDAQLKQRGLRRFRPEVGAVGGTAETMRVVQVLPGGSGPYIGQVVRDGLVRNDGVIVARAQVISSADAVPSAMPVPNPAAAMDEGAILTHDAAQRAALGFETHRYGEGWKLHLGFDASDPAVVAEVEAVMKDLRKRGLTVNFKIGKQGDQIGKDATVYVGARDMADYVAAEIDKALGHHLNPPMGEVLEDDIPFVGNVVGRFENSASPRGRAASAAGVPVDEKGMHQYGAKGHAVLNWDVREVQAGRLDPAEAARRADGVLRQQYGDFYTGTGPGKAEVPPPEAQAAGAAPPPPDGPPPPEAPTPDEFDHDRIRAAQQGLDILRGMTEREWLQEQLGIARTQRAKVHGEARSKWNRREGDIKKALRVLDIAESGGKKKYTGYKTGYQRKKIVRHTVGDRAKEMVAPNRIAPFVFHAAGIETEQGRTFNVMRLNSYVSPSMVSKVRKPGQVSEQYARHGAEVEALFSAPIDSTLLRRYNLPANIFVDVTPMMLVEGMDDLRAGALRNPQFAHFVTRYLENIEGELKRIMGDDYRLEDLLDDRLVTTRGLDHYPIRQWEIDHEGMTRVINEAKGDVDKRQTRTNLPQRPADDPPEQALSELVERDLRVVVAKAKYAAENGIDLHAYNEMYKVAVKTTIRKHSGWQIVRDASRKAYATLTAQGRSVNDLDWDKVYRAEYVKEFDIVRNRLAGDEALALLDRLTMEMPADASVMDIITEFEARFSLNMEVKGEEKFEVTAFQMRSMEEATKELLRVADLKDPQQLKVGLSRHETAPPSHSIDERRKWLTQYGFWSPRRAEDIEKGHASWSIQEEAKYNIEHWGDTPEFADPSLFREGGDFRYLLFDERRRGEALRRWGAFNLGMEARFKTGTMTIEERAKFYVEGSEVYGIKPRRDLAAERKYVMERYRDLVVDREGRLIAFPELMLESERRLYIKNTTAQNIPDGMFKDSQSHEIFMNYLNYHVDKLFDEHYVEGKPIEWEDVFVMSANVIHDMLLDPIWLKRENSAIGDFLVFESTFRRMAVMTNPAFTVTNVADLAVKVPWTRIRDRSFFRPGMEAPAAVKAMPGSYFGLDPGGQFLRDTPLNGTTRIQRAGSYVRHYALPDGTLVPETRAQKLMADNLQRVLGAAEIPAQLAGMAQDHAMLRTAQGIYPEAYRRGVQEFGFSPKVADAYARKFAGEEAMAVFPTMGDGPLEKLLNMIFPFMSYQAKNRIFWIGEFAANPWLFTYLNTIGNGIEASNRQNWAREGTLDVHTDLEARRFELPWAPGVFVDFGKMSDAAAGIEPVMDWMEGKATVQSLASQFIRLASANDINTALGWMNALNFGQRLQWRQVKDANGRNTGHWEQVPVPWDSPFGGTANWLNSFWPVQLANEGYLAVLDGKLTAEEVTKVAYRAAFFGGMTYHDRGKGLSDFYFTLQSKDPEAAAAFLLTNDGIALKSYWVQHISRTRDFNSEDIQKILFPEKYKSASWFSQQPYDFKQKVLQGFDDLELIRKKWDNILWKATPGTPEFDEFKLRSYTERYQYYLDHPWMFEWDGFTKSPGEWQEDMDEWTVDNMMDAFFEMKAPDRDDPKYPPGLKGEQAYQKDYAKWKKDRTRFLAANPKVADRLQRTRTGVENIWKETERYWFDHVLDKIGTRQIAIEAAKQAKDYPLSDQLYLANDADYMKLNEEVAVDYFDPTTDFLPLTAGQKERETGPSLRTDPFGNKLLRKVTVLPDFDKWRYLRATPEGKIKIKTDIKYASGMKAVVAAAKDAGGNFGAAFTKELKEHPWLLKQYFDRNPGKQEQWAENDSYIKQISKFGRLMQAGKFDEGHRYFDSLPDWVKNRYYNKHPEKRQRRTSGVRNLAYMNYMKRWTDHYKKRDYSGGAAFFEKMPQWVKDRYYQKHPTGFGRGASTTGSSPYSRAMGKWVKLLQDGDSAGAEAYFKSLPQEYKDRYYKGHPEAKLRNDIKRVGQLGEYFAADDATRVEYLKDNPEFAKWLHEQGDSEQTRRMLIAAAFRGLPADNPWLKRMFQEKFPEVFSKEAIGEVRINKVLSFLAEHPDMSPEFAKWLASVWQSFTESTKYMKKNRPKPIELIREGQHGMVNRQRPHGGKSAAWVRLHSLT